MSPPRNPVRFRPRCSKALALVCLRSIEVRIVDLGGTNGSDSASPVARFAGTVPEVVFGFLKRAEALGIDVNGVLEKLGIDAAGLVTLATKKSADAPDEEARF